MAKKFICPDCKSDLQKVGLYNIQNGTMSFYCNTNKKGEIGNWEENEFETLDAGEFFCENCKSEIDVDELGLTL